MSGLHTLAAEGLDLAALDDAPAGQGAISDEVLRWHHLPAMPDSDITVLLWVRDGSGADWLSGWWDGQMWCDCAHGGEVTGTVLARAALRGAVLRQRVGRVRPQLGPAAGHHHHA